MADTTSYSQFKKRKEREGLINNSIENNETQKERLFIFGGFDYVMLTAVLFLIGFGLIMIYSASTYASIKNFNTPTYYFSRQLFFALVAIGMMFFVSMINYKFIAKLIIPIYLVTNLLLVAVLIFGDETKGSKRWINVGPINLQPSEIAKCAMIIIASYVCAKTAKNMKSNLKIIFLYGCVVIVPGILVGVQNLSTAIVVAVIPFVIFFVANKKKMWVIVTIIIGIGAILVFLYAPMFKYRRKRIEAWKDPFAYIQDIGYQTVQSLYAIGSGGLFGKGLGQSIQKLGFIPEAHNDIIFSIICEELGLFGAVIVLFIFSLLLYRCMCVARRAPDSFGMLLAVGLMTQIAVQVIINIAVVTNTVPNTGMPLPFISYGGSSLLFLLMSVGVVLNVSKQRKY